LHIPARDINAEINDRENCCRHQMSVGAVKISGTAIGVSGTNPDNSYDVTERTLSMYREMTFAGTNWGGNLGLRIVRTNTTASTAVAAPVSLWTPSDTNSSTETWNVQYAAGQQSVTKGRYVLPLPSAN
jgi:hypothetical protein